MLRLSQPNISEEAISAVTAVLRSGQLVHGIECEVFEQELAAYLGCCEVVLVSSGTAALHVALMALNIGRGDAVIVPDFTFPATANAVAMTGARPVIVDVLPGTYTLDPTQLEKIVQSWRGLERLRAVMPVHEFGCVADMPKINRIAQQHGLAVIEDAACALGASLGGRKAGTWGDAGCFSFHPRKTLTTGEGGAISTDNAELAARMRRLRNHGMERSAEGMRFFEPATNYRLTNFQAALGRAQLPLLDAWIKKRRQLAQAYLAALGPLVSQGCLSVPNWVEEHSWQTFMVVLNSTLERKKLISDLLKQGIESNLGAQSLSEIGLYQDHLDLTALGREFYKNGLALPLFEQMTIKDVQKVCRTLGAVLAK